MVRPASHLCDDTRVALRTALMPLASDTGSAHSRAREQNRNL